MRDSRRLGTVKLRILILGADGYLGWPTSLHLSDAGHVVALADNFARRRYDEELGLRSLVPIASMDNRLDAWQEVSGNRLELYRGDLLDGDFVYETIRDFGPETIVHFAEQRAAPYSMIDREHAVYTQHNNVIGTLNVLFAIAELDASIHLVKLGTMGEYGTPNIDIEEGWLNVTHKGRSDRVLFPKKPGSIYHLSKVHDSHNIEFACRVWDLAATDLNQGIVYGQETQQTTRDPRLATRFDYDAIFGTVLNRFVIQAVLGHPLTVYGEGAQIRGLIDIRDTIECIRLAAENPAGAGEFRVFNQMTESFSVRELAGAVVRAFPGQATLEYLDNPRVEQAKHYYKVVHSGLRELGLQPHLLSDTLIDSMFDVVRRCADHVDVAALRPTVNWRHARNTVSRGGRCPVWRPVMPQLPGTTVAAQLADATEKLRAAGCAAFAEEAELLIATALAISPSELGARAGESLSKTALASIEDLIARRSAREPLEYITGRCSFRGLELDVDDRVLVPQELSGPLVELAHALDLGSRVHDVGTGCGAIALAIKHERPDLVLSGSDVSADAIAVARSNAAKLGLDVSFSVASGLPSGQFDLVVANLPYQDEAGKTMSLRPELTFHMPRVAVFSGDIDGLGVIRAFVASVRCDATVAIEHATPQTETVRKMFHTARVMGECTDSRQFTVGKLLTAER